MVETSGDLGNNQPMRLFSNQGKQMCTGSYSISMFEAVAGAGTFSLKCFDDGSAVNGELHVKSIANPRGNGTLDVIIGTADILTGEQVAWIAGIPYALIKKHPELIENVAQ